MINPGEIPQIPGNMDTLATHAQTVRTVGVDFANTGQAVDSTWQGLAAVYKAPEAAQLFAATGPVRTVSASVGEDIQAVGAALATYATEVKEIKAQLAALKSQAEEFVGSIKDDEDWREDQGKVDKHNGLITAVDTQVAAFFEAQRKCANTINALYGGRQYRADNADGQAEDGEYGFTADTLNAAAGEDGALPWGSTEEHDRGFFGDVGAYFVGMGISFVTMLQDLGGLIGRDPTTGDWSWGTAGQSWLGLGKFVWAVSIYVNPVTIVIDQTVGMPFMEQREAGNLLLNAGKTIIAYDTWGEDKSKAAGMATFNIVSAIVGTKGAASGLRGAGAAVNTIRGSATAARISAALVRTGNWIDKLPTVGEVAINFARKFDIKIPQLGLVPAIAGDVPIGRGFDVDMPHVRGGDAMHMDGGNGPGGHLPGGNTPGGHVPGDLTPGGHIPDGNAPGGHIPDGNTPGGNLPEGNTPGGNLPDGNGPGGNLPEGNAPDGNPPAGGIPDRGRDLTPDEQQRFVDQAERLNPAARAQALELLARTDLPEGVASRAVRDFVDLQDSGRLAGSADRQAQVLRDMMEQLGGDRSAAAGAAAELRAANDVLNSPDLMPGSKIGISVKNEPVDFGTGTVIHTGDVPESDLVYQTRDGKVHLDEVKATAQTVANKLSEKPEQLDRMLEWRAADPAGRAVSYRVGTDEGLKGLFSMTNPQPKQYALDRIADADVPVQIGGRTLTPDQLRQLREAALEASVHPAHPMKRGQSAAWFDEHMPNLAAARDFLEPFGVRFL